MNYFLTRIILPFLVFLVAISIAYGQDSSVVADTTYRNRVLFLPAIGASPETGFLLGGVVVPQFKVGHAGLETRSSSILISGIYTIKKTNTY